MPRDVRRVRCPLRGWHARCSERVWMRPTRDYPPPRWAPPRPRPELRLLPATSDRPQSGSDTRTVAPGARPKKQEGPAEGGWPFWILRTNQLVDPDAGRNRLIGARCAVDRSQVRIGLRPVRVRVVADAGGALCGRPRKRSLRLVVLIHEDAVGPRARAGRVVHERAGHVVRIRAGEELDVVVVEALVALPLDARAVDEERDRLIAEDAVRGESPRAGVVAEVGPRQHRAAG